MIEFFENEKKLAKLLILKSKTRKFSTRKSYLRWDLIQQSLVRQPMTRSVVGSRIFKLTPVNVSIYF